LIRIWKNTDFLNTVDGNRKWCSFVVGMQNSEWNFLKLLKEGRSWPGLGDN
jgi:hypothetical protein